MTPPTFAELLHHHRVARGLTRAQLATQAGVNAELRSPAFPDPASGSYAT
jgi:hypothetical protein